MKRGLIAAAGGVFRIAEQLPRKVAMELLFTGEPMSAADAAKWGLINQVVPDGTVLQAALALAERIIVNAPLSVQASKRVAYGVDDGVIDGEEPKWDRIIREIGTLLKSEDAKEGRWRSPKSVSPFGRHADEATGFRGRARSVL